MLEARRWVSWARHGWVALLLAPQLVAAQAVTVTLDPPLDQAAPRVAGAEVAVAGRTAPRAAVTLCVRGANVQVVLAGPDGHFSFTPTVLLNGPNQLTVSARLDDQTGSVSRQVVAERALPKLVLDPPYHASPTPLLGEARPYIGGRTAAGATVRCRQGADEACVVAGRDGRFLVQVPRPLREGDNELQFSVCDANGVETRSSLVVRHGSQPPTVELSLPADGARVDGPAVNVVGRTKAGSRLRVVVNGQPVLDTLVEGDGSFVFAGVPLAEGTNTLVVRAIDAAGQQAEVQRQVVREPGVGVLQLDAPLDLVQVRTVATRIAVSGRTWPKRAVTLAVGKRAEVSQVSDEQGRFRFADVDLVDGENVLRVAAGEAGGGQVVVERCVEVDRQPPIIHLTLPGPTDYVETPKLSLRGRTEPDAAYEVRGKGAALTGRADAFGNFQLDVPIADGPNQYSLLVRDDLGNQAVLPMLIFGRVSDPLLEVKTPTQGWQASSQVVLDFDYEADTNVELTLDEREVSGWNASAPGGEPIPHCEGRLALGKLKPGDHELRAVVTSPSGRRRSAVVRKFYVPGGPRELNARLLPPTIDPAGVLQLNVDVLDERGQPVEDDTVVLVELPPGWRADGKAAGPDDQVRLATRQGKASVRLSDGGRADSGVILVSAGRFTDGPTVRVRPSRW